MPIIAQACSLGVGSSRRRISRRAARRAPRPARSRSQISRSPTQVSEKARGACTPRAMTTALRLTDMYCTYSSPAKYCSIARLPLDQSIQTARCVGDTRTYTHTLPPTYTLAYANADDTYSLSLAPSNCIGGADSLSLPLPLSCVFSLCPAPPLKGY